MNSNIRKVILLLSGGLLIVTQPGAGCVSDTPSDGGQNAPPRNDPYSRNDPNPPQDNRPREEDPNYIPQCADIVREGRGVLRYTAEADGVIYIQNLRREETQLQRRVHRGQLIEVSPDENRIRIDNDTVSKTDLKREDVHRLYLLRDRRFEDDRTRGNNRDRKPEDNQRPQNDKSAPNDNAVSRGIPADSQLMGEGKNKEINFRPSKAGSVYIYSVEDQRLVARIAIRSGDVFVLSPGRSRATINGRTVEQNVFDTRITYRVFFNRDN